MHLPHTAEPGDPREQHKADRRRIRRALNITLAFILLLAAVFSAQEHFDVAAWAVAPQVLEGLRGVLTAPLLHGSITHLGANAVALLMLGTLAGSVYPRATIRALPFLWLGSGLGAWTLGVAGTHHLGASGVTHGLMFLVFTLGLLRRDRPAIAAAMIVFFLYGGMLLTVLPQEPGISWQSHLGGAIAGVLSAFVFRHRDPMPPRKRYSWEIEEELAEKSEDELEMSAPKDVPVLWQRNEEERGKVLRFPPRAD